MIAFRRDLDAVGLPMEAAAVGPDLAALLLLREALVYQALTVQDIEETARFLRQLPPAAARRPRR